MALIQRPVVDVETSCTVHRFPFKSLESSSYRELLLVQETTRLPKKRMQSQRERWLAGTLRIEMRRSIGVVNT